MQYMKFNLPAPMNGTYKAKVVKFDYKTGNGTAECPICESKGYHNVDLIGSNYIWKCKYGHELLGPY